jgi:diguanylate cyclase (GGDEF)-like protein
VHCPLDPRTVTRVAPEGRAGTARDDTCAGEAAAPTQGPTRAHANVLTLRTTERRRDRRLQGGASRPITGQIEFVLGRGLSLVGSGILALTAYDHPHSTAIGLTLLVAGVLQPVVPRLPPRRAVAEYQGVLDLVVIAILLPLAPTLWPMAMLWIGSGIALQALISPPRIALAVSAAAITVIVGLGIAIDQPEWYFAATTAAFLLAAFTFYGRSLRREIWEQESVLLDALTAAGAVVHHSDLDRGVVDRVEGDLEGILGWTPAEWAAIDHRNFLHPDDVAAYWVEVDDVEPDTVLDRVARFLCKDGTYRWMRDVALVTEDGRGRRALRGYSLDVTELEEANATIARQLRHDTLTGLPNRLHLNEHLNALLESDTDFALMLTDLDRFKEVNDTLGHESGDQLLQVIAARLAAAVRPGDLVARLGGDEYAVVLVDANDDEIGEVAHRIGVECARPMVLNGLAVAVATSTGIAMRSRSGRDRATMLRHADIAMYEAKRSSVSYRLFDASLEQTSTLRLSLTATLGDAIESGELTAYYQPKYDMATRRLVGAEALARWNHPEFGLLTPAAFLDIALMSEHAVPFAIATVSRAASTIRALIDAGAPVPIAANVAMRALRDPDFAPAVLDALAAAGAPPELLVLELTESDPLWPDLKAGLGVQGLVDAGVELSIDDFGTGHSSLERLRAIRVHELKIDRSFVSGMTASPLQRQLVGTIIDLSSGMGFRTVAEGVETEEERAMLLNLGCTIAQGYLFSRPIPEAEFLSRVVAEAVVGTHSAR